MSAVAERLELVRERIRGAAERAGRDPASVRLIAVSKMQPAEAILAAYAAGQRDFGENYVQELTAKAGALAHLTDLRWHMIGHLQRNKARHVVRYVSAIHSVDSADLALELGKRVRADDAGTPRTLSVLVEVNIAREPQKHGVDPDALEPVLAAIEGEPGLALSGLMCVPPASEHAEAARLYFDALALLRDQHGGRARLPELSMGMTQDLEPAILAGASFVRVGTAIFGERPPKAD
jgi:PLP dependent protein